MKALFISILLGYKSTLLIMSPDYLFDVIAITVSLFALITYHAYIYISVFVFMSDRIQLSTNMKNSVFWINKHGQKGDAPTVTLAIQTLRNTILIAIFVGGYSLQLGISTINTYSNSMGIFEAFRCIVIGILSLASFLSWATVIRIASHLGYMVGTLDYDTKMINKISAAIDEKNEFEASAAVPAEEAVIHRRRGSFRRVPLEQAAEKEPPNIPKESARMLQMMLICVK